MDVETTIIGAGPYGLSLAAHLRAKGRPYQIFGSPLESWRMFMPEGMVLKSEPFASNLWDPRRRFTFRQYCATHGIPYQAVGRPVPLSLFLKYADWFRQNTQEEPAQVRVVNLRHGHGAFSLQLADGRALTSRRVVLATGHLTYSVMPEVLAGLPESQVVHSSRMGALQQYAGRDVTVVGAGQSALENAALLHEAGAHVRLLVREPRIEWNSQSMPRSLLQRIRAPDAGVAMGWNHWAISELPRIFRCMFPPEKRHPFVLDAYGPSGAWWLRKRVEGKIESWVRSNIQAASVADGRVRLRISAPTGGQELETDHVIAATGYRVDFDRIEYLEPELRHRVVREGKGIPALTSRFETSVPGLFVIGITSAPVFGPIMRFMYGAKHAARIVAGALG
jgi:thioredoxin reductase